MITFEVKEGSNKVEMYLKKTSLFFKNRKYLDNLEQAGRDGLEALRQYTPKDTGLTSESWNYEITVSDEGCRITWTNSNVREGWFNVALALQFGHGTGRGGYVEGVDYINPALRPIFERLSMELWEEVNS